MDWCSWTLARLVFGYVTVPRIHERWSLVGVTYSFTAQKWGRAIVDEAYGHHDATVAAHGDAAAIAGFASDQATGHYYSGLADQQQIALGAVLRADAARDWFAMPPAWRQEWLKLVRRGGRRRPPGGGGAPPGSSGFGPRGGGPPIRPLIGNPGVGQTAMTEQVVITGDNDRVVELVPNPATLGVLNPWPLPPSP